VNGRKKEEARGRRKRDRKGSKTATRRTKDVRKEPKGDTLELSITTLPASTIITPFFIVFVVFIFVLEIKVEKQEQKESRYIVFILILLFQWRACRA